MSEIVVPYTPFPIFNPFHRSRVREKHALGAVGSGKTIGLCGDAIGFAFEQPGSRIMLCRDTVPSLRDTTEAEFLNIISQPPPDGGMTLYQLIESKKWIRRSGGHIDRLWMPGGSEILFRSLDDWRKLMSLNLAYIGIDEAAQISQETYENLLSRLRQQEPTAMAMEQTDSPEALDELLYQWREPRQHMVSVSNPDGQNWIWKRFIDDKEPNRRLFRSTSFDNPTFFDENGQPNEYLKSLMLMPPLWIDRFVLCKTDTFSGQVYPQFDAKTHVHEHFEPTGPEWERGMGLDWGIDNPTAIGWWARQKGTTKWFKYREWQSYDPDEAGSRERNDVHSVADVAALIHELEQGEEIKWRGADPMLFRKQTGDKDNETIDYFFRKYDLFFQPGALRDAPRINSMNQIIGAGDCSISYACPLTIRYMQQYRWERLKVNQLGVNEPERPLKKNDHLLNADQYLMTLFTQATGLPEAPKQPSWNDLVWDKVRRQRSAKMNTQPRR